MKVSKVISMALTGIIIMLLSSTIIYAQSNNDAVPSISPETAQKAKDYFEVLSLITISMNSSACDQIQRDIRATNTPQNRKKMDFDLSSLPGKISQQIAQQYKDDIQAFKEANNNYLSVCKSSPLAHDANMDLHALFKSSVDKADARYHQMKVEADKAAAEAAIVKAEAEKAKANADREQAIAAQKRAEADRDRANADHGNTNLTDEEVVNKFSQMCKEQFTGILEYNLCFAGAVCSLVVYKDKPSFRTSERCMDCCKELNKKSEIDLTPGLSVCQKFCVNNVQGALKTY